MSRVQANQGGSVVSFVVIGIVLVGLAVGGIYLLRHRSSTGSSEVATTNSPTASPSPNGTSAPAPSSSSTSTPAPSKSTTPTPTPSSSSAPAAEAVPENMPATGPSDLLPGGVMVAVLLGVTVAYTQSRTARKHAALNQ